MSEMRAIRERVDQSAVPLDEPWADMSVQTPQAPLVTFVGASGGVGLSSMALVMAYLAAAEDIDTVLIEGDLQFGDYAYWLGLDDGLPDLGAGRSARPIQLTERLNLFKAPVFPELAEEVCEGIAGSLGRMRTGAGLAIADAGSYWSGLTAQMLHESSLFFMVVDPRPASVYGAVRAAELCARIGVPSARMIAVYNRWSSKVALSDKEVARLLGVQRLYCIPDGKAAVDKFVGSGNVSGLIEAGNPMVKGVKAMLTELMPFIGYGPGEQPRHKGGLFR